MKYIPKLTIAGALIGVSFAIESLLWKGMLVGIGVMIIGIEMGRRMK